MQNIAELLSVLQNQFSNTNLQNFASIVESILSLSRPVTTLSVARMSPISYRTVQRFYALKEINWHLINLILFKTFIYQEGKTYLLAADETVEDKAGKSTYGISRFYSSIIQKSIRSVSFLATVIIDVDNKKSFFLACQQIISVRKTENNTQKPDRYPKPKGRPKGSKNKSKTESMATSYQTLRALLSLIVSQLSVFLPNLKCFHLVLDGFYGHEDYLLLALTHELNIISKFKTNAHLLLPYKGEQSGKGRPKTKGERVDLEKISQSFFVENINHAASKVSTSVYQFKAYTPKIAKHLLNIVVLVHQHQLTKKQTKTILFSSDLSLTANQLIEYYSLRFQIEFDFRDAKQFYGLSTFKNYHQTQVRNAVNLSFTMTLIGKLLLKKYKEKWQCDPMGISDLKLLLRIQKHSEIFLNYTKTDPDAFLNSPQFLNLIKLEAIHI